MVGFEEALERADSMRGCITRYMELENAYVFDGDEESDGGRTPIAIMKDGGGAYDFVWALESDMLGALVSTGKVNGR